jgi:hypothetical protein
MEEVIITIIGTKDLDSNEYYSKDNIPERISELLDYSYKYSILIARK